MRYSARIFSYALYLFTALVVIAAFVVALKSMREREKPYACMLDAMKKVPDVHDAEMEYSKIKGRYHPVFKYNYPDEKGVLTGRPPREEFVIQTDGGFIEKAFDLFQTLGHPAKKFDIEIDGFIDESKPAQVQTWIIFDGLSYRRNQAAHYWGTTEIARAWKIKCGVSLVSLSE